MKYLLIICLLFIVGCPPLTIPVLTTIGTGAIGINKFVDYKLTKRGLDLKEREIELKEKIFEESKVR